MILANGIHVIPGKIGISSASYLTKHDDVIVLEVDCIQKYPKISCYEDNDVVITSGKYTVGDLEDKENDTRVGVDDANADWLVFAEVAQYTVMICYVKIH